MAISECELGVSTRDVSLEGTWVVIMAGETTVYGSPRTDSDIGHWGDFPRQDS